MAKKKRAVLGRMLLGQGLGFLAWIAGFHCIEVDGQGMAHLSGRKLRIHCLRVFFWAFGLALLFHLPGAYARWSMGAPGHEKMELGGELLLFLLYVQLFWKRVFIRFLPGVHEFLCPQCYRRQTFRFFPVSFQYGFWVTYLCSYCFCLVDGWGRQIFYPHPITLQKLRPFLVKTILLVLASLALGSSGFEMVWKIFSGA